MTSNYELPPAFYVAIKRARRLGLWVKASRFDISEARYVITRAYSSEPIFSSDDIGEIRQWLRDMGGG